jgi:hypothetical protein
MHLPAINFNLSMNPTNNEKTECPSKRMCLHSGKKTCIMNNSVGIKLVTSSIHDRFNTYKLHIATPKIKGANNVYLKMAPYIIRHYIIQSYARDSTLVGFNIVMNIPGCVLIKIQQNFPIKVGFYKECSLNITGNEQPPVEVFLIESEIEM